MKKPCKTCPFLKNTENFGNADWLYDCVKGFSQGSLDHTCHTSDPNADGYVGGNAEMCWGIVGLMEKMNYKFIVPKAFQTKEKIDSSGVFDTAHDFVLHHLNEIKKLGDTCP